MSQTYPGLVAPSPPLSSKQRAQAAKRAKLILESLEVGIALSRDDVHWLYDHTGYPRYTKSAEYMAARIVDTYKLDLITDRITS